AARRQRPALASAQPWRQFLASGDDVLEDLEHALLRIAVQLEEPLVVGELKYVEDETARVGQRVPANDVHPERRQHTADVREQIRLFEGEQRQPPNGWSPKLHP